MSVVLERGECIAAVKAAGGDDLGIAVVDHGGSEDEAHQECTPGLQVIQEFGQSVTFPAESRIEDSPGGCGLMSICSGRCLRRHEGWCG